MLSQTYFLVCWFVCVKDFSLLDTISASSPRISLIWFTKVDLRKRHKASECKREHEARGALCHMNVKMPKQLVFVQLMENRKMDVHERRRG